MKKIGIILLMSVIAQMSFGQLSHRIEWEKTIMKDSNAYYLKYYPPYIIDFNNYQTAQGTSVFSFNYIPCMAKCSTVVVTVGVSPVGALKTVKQMTTDGQPVSYWSKNFLVTFDRYDTTYQTQIYDSELDHKGTVSGRVTDMVVYNKGFYATVRKKYSSISQSVRLNQQLQVEKTATQSGLFWNNGIVNMSVEKASDTETQLTKFDEEEKIEWSVKIKNTREKLKILGIDANDNLLVVSTNDNSLYSLLKFDLSGKKIAEWSLSYLSYGVESFWDTSDGGMILYGYGIIGNKGLYKLDNQGKVQWQMTTEYRPMQLFTYPNGNVQVVHNKENSTVLTLLSQEGKIYFEDKVNRKTIFAPSNGWTYAGSATKLFAFNSTGQLAWSRDGNYEESQMSLDKDNSLLVQIYSERLRTPVYTQYSYFDRNYKIQKFTGKGRVLWEVPLSFPVADTAKDYVMFHGIFPAEGGGYFALKSSFTHIPQNEVLGSKISLVKITRPCYENLNATLKSPASLLCEGQKLQLTSNTDSLNFLSYQWQRDGQTLATTRQSTFDATAAGTYRVIVRDSVCGTSFTSAEVKIQPRAALQPLITTTGSTDFCEGADVATLTVSAPKAEMSYQWYRNGQSLGSAFQTSLRVTEAGRYQLFAQDAVCNANALSPAVVVNVRPLPEAKVTPEINGVVYAPFKAKLKANEGAGMTYQWYKEGVEIAGEKGVIYEAGESGSYSVRVNKDGCSRTSSALSISILQPLGVEVIEVDEVKVYPNPTGGHFQLTLPQQWQKAEVELIDLMGRQLPLRRDNDHYQTEATAGAFWLRIRMGEKEIKKRLIIVR